MRSGKTYGFGWEEAAQNRSGGDVVTLTRATPRRETLKANGAMPNSEAVIFTIELFVVQGVQYERAR